MLTKSEEETILKCAKKYDVSDVFLFGSSLEKDREANDIDLGVKGLKPKYFFKFYGELFSSLTKPVDLVDLSKKSLFTSLIERDGKRLYVRSI